MKAVLMNVLLLSVAVGLVAWEVETLLGAQHINEPDSLYGKAQAWCWDNNACSAFALSCGPSSNCTQIGQACGHRRDLRHPETCNPVIGNNYCGSPTNVQVVCADEWDCFCTTLVGGGGGWTCGEPFGSHEVGGTISTDSVNCSYTAYVP